MENSLVEKISFDRGELMGKALDNKHVCSYALGVGAGLAGRGVESICGGTESFAYLLGSALRYADLECGEGSASECLMPSGENVKSLASNVFGMMTANADRIYLGVESLYGLII